MRGLRLKRRAGRRVRVSVRAAVAVVAAAAGVAGVVVLANWRVGLAAGLAGGAIAATRMRFSSAAGVGAVVVVVVLAVAGLTPGADARARAGWRACGAVAWPGAGPVRVEVRGTSCRRALLVLEAMPRVGSSRVLGYRCARRAGLSGSCRRLGARIVWRR